MLPNNEFESYLQDEFLKQYPMTTKDNCEDLFENWLADMDLDLLLLHGDKFGTLMQLKAIKEFSEKLKIK